MDLNSTLGFYSYDWTAPAGVSFVSYDDERPPPVVCDADQRKAAREAFVRMKSMAFRAMTARYTQHDWEQLFGASDPAVVKKVFRSLASYSKDSILLNCWRHSKDSKCKPWMNSSYYERNNNSIVMILCPSFFRLSPRFKCGVQFKAKGQNPEAFQDLVFIDHFLHTLKAGETDLSDMVGDRFIRSGKEVHQLAEESLGGRVNASMYPQNLVASYMWFAAAIDFTFGPNCTDP
ncbi:MAG: hypothetical protein M1838_002143 [Thelocarpon superellum]|nr:MAG: hypothetical protein M1838_002143 [Thelocarpon superellum]